MALVLGMAIDANVLINERVREELRNGKTAPSAVEQGFGRAWLTIIDTHVTTIVSAFILFIFGTGPVRIGRNALNDAALPFPFVSQWHAVVAFDAAVMLPDHPEGKPIGVARWMSGDDGPPELSITIIDPAYEGNPREEVELMAEALLWWAWPLLIPDENHTAYSLALAEPGGGAEGC